MQYALFEYYDNVSLFNSCFQIFEAIPYIYKRVSLNVVIVCRVTVHCPNAHELIKWGTQDYCLAKNVMLMKLLGK